MPGRIPMMVPMSELTTVVLPVPLSHSFLGSIGVASILRRSTFALMFRVEATISEMANRPINTGRLEKPPCSCHCPKVKRVTVDTESVPTIPARMPRIAEM